MHPRLTPAPPVRAVGNPLPAMILIDNQFGVYRSRRRIPHRPSGQPARRSLGVVHCGLVATTTAAEAT